MNKIVDCNVENIRLKVINHSNLNLPIEIMRLFPQGIDTTQLVQWDISGETFDTSYVSLGTTVPLTGNAKTLDIFGVVQVLNSFNVALFFYIGTVIYAVNLKNPSVTTADLTIGTTTSPYFNIGTGFNNIAYSVDIQSDGKIIVVGGFLSYRGVLAKQIIRLNPTGNIDTSFVYGSGFNNFVTEIVKIQPDGKILVGGDFTEYNGTLANRIIRLNTDGSVDSSFIYGTGFVDNTVYAIAIQADGKILIGGSFTSYNGTPSNRIIRLNADGSVDGTFIYGTGFSNTVRDIVIQPDGKILVVGNFTGYDGSGANRIIRLEANGTRDALFVIGTGFNTLSTYVLGIQADGKILAGGQFTSYNGIAANRIIRLNPNGSKDNTFIYGSGMNDLIYDFAIQSDGKILICGNFSIYNTVDATGIIRLNTDGSVDGTFVYGTGFVGTAIDMSILPDGKIILIGGFSDYDSMSYNRIIRLNPDGSSDTIT